MQVWVDSHDRVTVTGLRSSMTTACEATEPRGRFAPAFFKTTGRRSSISILPNTRTGRAAYVGVLLFGAGTVTTWDRSHTRRTPEPVLFSHGQESDPRMI